MKILACYTYKVLYDNEVTEKSEEVSGIIFADNFGDAAEKVAAAYGEINVDTITLKWLSDGSILEMGEIPHE